jgi:hypothetical protein
MNFKNLCYLRRFQVSGVIYCAPQPPGVGLYYHMIVSLARQPQPGGFPQCDTDCTVQYTLGCPAKRIFFLSVRTETNRNTDSFCSVSVFFPKEYNHLFRFVSVCFGISKPFRNKPKLQKLN